MYRIQCAQRLSAKEPEFHGRPPQNLLPGECEAINLIPWYLHGKNSGSCITKGQTFPVIRNPVTIGHLHTAGGAIPCENHIICKVNLRKIGQFSVLGGMLVDIGYLEFLFNVIRPAFAEGLKGNNINTLAPNTFHINISNAPVSDPGTIPTR